MYKPITKVWVVLNREDSSESWTIMYAASRANSCVLAIFDSRRECLNELKELREIFGRDAEIISRRINISDIGTFLIA